jgi:hypothetical protein
VAEFMRSVLVGDIGGGLFFFFCLMYVIHPVAQCPGYAFHTILRIIIQESVCGKN